MQSKNIFVAICWCLFFFFLVRQKIRTREFFPLKKRSCMPILIRIKERCFLFWGCYKTYYAQIIKFKKKRITWTNLGIKIELCKRGKKNIQYVRVSPLASSNKTPCPQLQEGENAISTCAERSSGYGKSPTKKTHASSNGRFVRWVCLDLFLHKKCMTHHF